MSSLKPPSANESEVDFDVRAEAGGAATIVYALSAIKGVGDAAAEALVEARGGRHGPEVLRNRALNCWPWARSLIHSPDAVIHSPAEMMAAWPTTVTKSRWPRAFALRTQKPFSALWKVTRSTRPASTSWVDGSELDLIGIAGSSLLISWRAVVTSRAEHT
jgi:Helix-hairpin-helix motif